MSLRSADATQEKRDYRYINGKSLLSEPKIREYRRMEIMAYPLHHASCWIMSGVITRKFAKNSAIRTGYFAYIYSLRVKYPAACGGVLYSEKFASHPFRNKQYYFL
ncbi:hypothetical protein [Chlorobaculum sp. 24CR]|uniref:hypothetical protein n=1 Tax=Chlorobaculum sp. 24CR TaxID=2508878 RepID=UPI00142FA9E9|nr:hypothetical protein [Chlorobaculum sp. 24CR]